MSDQLKWGILGTGKMAKKLAQALAESPIGTLTAIGSRSEVSAKTFQDEFQVPLHFSTYEALLASSEVEVVYISTPHPSHAEWAIRAAQAGKHILCEKPLTMNQAEAEHVMAAAQQHGVFLMEAFMYRCHPQTQHVVQLIRDGLVGDVRLIQASFSFQVPYDPMSRLFNANLGGGGILDVGCYTTSMARLLAGAARGGEAIEPLTIQGCGHLHPETGVDELAVANLEFPGKIIAQLACGVSQQLENVVKIFGSKGYLTIPSPWFCRGDHGHYTLLWQPIGAEAQTITGSASQGLYTYEIEAVSQYLQARQCPLMSWADSLGNMQTLDRWQQAVKAKPLASD
jgi:predicted dehydrogenase